MQAEINYNDYYWQLIVTPFTMLLGPVYTIMAELYHVFW